MQIWKAFLTKHYIYISSNGSYQYQPIPVLLGRNLYGLKQAGLLCHLYLNDNYVMSYWDPSIIVSFYVDDIAIFAKN